VFTSGVNHKLLPCAAAMACTLALSCPAGADPSARAHVPDAADYAPNATASSVADVIKGQSLPFERDQTLLTDPDRVYADRRGFTQVTSFSGSDAWDRPVSIGGLSLSGSQSMSLRLHDSLGDPAQVDISSLLGRRRNDAGQGNSATPAEERPHSDGLFERLQRTVAGLQRRLPAFANTQQSAETNTSGLHWTALRTGDPGGMNAGVMQWNTGDVHGHGLSFTADMAPLFGDGLDHRLSLGWGGIGTGHAGSIRLAGGRADGSRFEYATLAQSLFAGPNQRMSVAVSTFSIGGRRWNEALLTTARAVGAHNEIGFGFALQQSGASPFISWAQPLSHGGSLALSVGAPNSIATKAPIAIQFSCPL
jgi:hypothetical protein